MAYVIPFLTAVLFLISFLLFIFSRFMKRKLYIFFDESWVNVIIVFRMLAGFVVIAAAPASGAPALMIFIGITIIFVAFTTSVISHERLLELADWWQSLPILTLKAWALLWMIIWFLLGYIASPKEAFYSLYIENLIKQNPMIEKWLQIIQQCCQ